jgi:hypothetical protein
VTSKKLIVVANATLENAEFTNTESNGDTRLCPANSAVHTGGMNGDYCRIPDCSGKEYFDDHHMTVAAADRNWTVTFWNDDDTQEIQWSGGEYYSTQNTVSESSAWEIVSVLIEIDDAGEPVVHVSQWTD